MSKVKSVWIVTPLVALAALATGYYIASAHNISNVNPVSVIKKAIDPVGAEQAWIDKNLPSGTTSGTLPFPLLGANGSTISGTATYQNRFNVTAVDANTWHIVSGGTTQYTYSNGQLDSTWGNSTECTAKVREMDWLNSAMIISLNAGPQAIMYALKFPTRNLICDVTHRTNGTPDDSRPSDDLSLDYGSEDDAELALQAIIRHVNPDAAKVNDVEAKWVKDHLEIETTAKDTFNRPNFSTISYSALIYPLRVDDWVVKSTWTDRFEGQDAHYQQRCNIRPSEVDWQTATIHPSYGAFAVYDLSIDGDKGISCEGVNTDDNEATNMDKITHPVLEFATEEKAKQWLEDVRQHESSKEAAAPTKQ
jgi:hypothetical protein